MPARLSAMVLLSAALAACGFQLRGIDSAEHIEPVYVGAERDSEVLDAVRRNLRLAGIDVRDAPVGEVWRLTLLEEREEERTVSVTERGLAADIELSLEVSYRLEDHEGEVLIEPQWAGVERVFRQDPDNLAASSRERELLRAEMDSELAQQILRSLSALPRNDSGAGSRADPPG